MVKKEFGTLNIENVEKVVTFFSSSARGQASEIGVSGSFMSSLCARGYAKIVDVENAFICVNEYSQTYKKVEVNVYALIVSPSALYDFYCSSVERIALTKKSNAERLIEIAKCKLDEAEELLKSI